MDKTLIQLEKEMNEIAGRWNGDESGLQEDRAHASLEVIEKIKEIKTLLEELEINF